MYGRPAADAVAKRGLDEYQVDPGAARHPPPPRRPKGVTAMGWIRDFSASEGFFGRPRNIDNDAPRPLRHQLIDLVFHIVDQSTRDPTHMYQLIAQSLGMSASAHPYGGPRYAAGREIGRADWQSVYDLIIRLWPEFDRVGFGEIYREGVNRILAAHGIVWDLDETGHLVRILPPAVRRQVDTAIAELSAPCFESSLTLFNAARDAYDGRPRRDRDACANIFDAMESVAKIIYEMPNATFGDILNQARRNSSLQCYVIRTLESIYGLANNTFRHGMVVDFNLSPSEVDFVYLSCIGGILLFARHIPRAAGL